MGEEKKEHLLIIKLRNLGDFNQNFVQRLGLGEEGAVVTSFYFENSLLASLGRPVKAHDHPMSECRIAGQLHNFQGLMIASP